MAVLIHELLAAQAARTPDAVAVESRERALSYRDLDAQANQLAHHLRDLGVAAERCVAVRADRSAEALVAMLAIWKAGGTYLPLDPDLPEARRSFMIEDARPVTVLDPEWLRQQRHRFTSRGQVVPSGDVHASTAAYIIYTSGSTGRPKGVVVEHRGLPNLLRAQLEVLGVGPAHRVLQFASAGFDASIAEVIMALGSGATLCLASRDSLRGLALLDTLERERISCAILPPSLLAELPVRRLPALELLNVAGEPCPPSVIDRWAPGRRMFNHYGPTEATVWSTVARCEAGRAPTIGRAIPGVEVQVLDDLGRPVSPGVPGELCIAGPAVARGYLHQDELTRARFVSAETDAARLYRSGDLARWRPDGELDYLGRADGQLKIRGFRVETGEIEAVLCEHPGVRAAVVVLREDRPGDRRLVGYLVGEGTAPSPAVLRAHLCQRLPDYMIPSAFVALPELPRGASDKIDYRALPPPDGARGEAGYLAPRSDGERSVAEVFATVLGLDRVGLDDDFFALGGHSLLAVQAVARLGQQRGRLVPLARLLESPTVRELACALDAALAESDPMGREPEDELQPLSSAQRRLWLIDQLEPGSTVYHAPLVLRFTGPHAPDGATLSRALATVVERHDALRTVVAHTDDRPCAAAGPPWSAELPLIDVRGLPEAERERAVQRQTEVELSRPFDLGRGPLLRAVLLRLRDDEMVLHLHLHHLVTDGWSVGLLLDELMALCAGRPLPPLPVSYRDYARWETRTLEGPAGERLWRYWQRQLDGLSPLELPFDRTPPAARSRRGARVPLTFDRELVQAIDELARGHRSTLYMVLMAAFQALLARWTGRTDVSVATPVANRDREELRALIGCLVNTVVLRADASGDPTFRELLGRIRHAALGAWAHQAMPFERVVERLNPERTLQSMPLCPVMFVLQNAPLPTLNGDGYQVTIGEPHNGGAMFDLSLSLGWVDGALHGHFEYDLELFAPETIERLAGHFANLLAAAVARPDEQVSSLPLMSEAERRRVVSEWNATARAYPERTVAAWFDEQAARTPAADAVVTRAESLSYRALAERANRLAHHLVALGARGTLVGLSLERSPELMVAVLAVLKAGAACLPLDPSYPKDRLDRIVEEARPRLILTRAWLTEHGEAIGACPDSPGSAAGAEELAYVIYTSGSTGRPKGVCLPHRVLSNLTAWYIDTLGGGRRMLQLAPLSFDVSFYEMFATWCSGGALVLAEEPIRRDPLLLARAIAEHAVQDVVLPVVLLHQLAERFCDDAAPLGSLENVIATGEQLRVTPELRRLFSGLRARLHNHYGPSETHVITAYPLPADSAAWPMLPPIGRPIANAQVYVLDSQRRPVPIGHSGELYLGGAAVGHGYLGQPQLTDERFVDSPFGVGRLYKSGDLARFRSGGELEFLGRADRQLKVRGFRIEPAEIEAALAEHPRVNQAVVGLREGRLVAWLVAHGEAPGHAELREHLALRLPEYMVPAAFVCIEALPIGPTGKIDMNRLPALEHPRPAGAPRTPTEKRIAEIWAGLLGVPSMGVEDNFFDIGGHSLSATQAALRISRAFGIKLLARRVFERPTVASLAPLVDELIAAL